MDQEQQKEAKAYLKRKNDFFVRSIQELECTDKVYYEISIGNTKPIKQVTYRIASSISDFVKQELIQLRERAWPS
ncbi:4725_t:CDS:2 [Acaulospora morrowiae]|uniref:4725_t:CDS:1 n=1 Tax=Acaulospora morrowiae TaxID=94023 RepID=A0A9N8WEY3_9GLOM|nr:4725_t:CDS:2 [Acaulospora morrowiae]